MKKSTPLALLMLASSALSFAYAQNIANSIKPEIKQIVIFGDSLSDDGNLYKETLGIEPSSSQYYHGRFTSAPGNWVDYMQNNYNNQSIISNNTNKTGFIVDYAKGGATAYNYSDLSRKLKTFTDLKYDVATKIVGDINQQITTYLNQYSKADKSKTLAIIFAGANDFLWLGAWAQGTEDLSKANYNIIEQRAIQGVRQAISVLQKQGINNFIIAGLPDISKTPEFINGSYTPATKMTVHDSIVKYNDDLKTLSNHISSGKCLFFPINVLFDNLIKNQVLGYPHYNNVTTACLSASSQAKAITSLNQEQQFSLLQQAQTQSINSILQNTKITNEILAQTPISQTSVMSTLKSFHHLSCESTYLFWDHVHPTSITHKFIETKFATALENNFSLPHAQAACSSVKVKNNGGYVLQVTGTQCNSHKTFNQNITLGQSTILHLKANTPVKLQAIAGRNTSYILQANNNYTITCSGTTYIGFSCPLILKGENPITAH